jgi:hypothetical protein
MAGVATGDRPSTVNENTIAVSGANYLPHRKGDRLLFLR